MFAAAGAVQVDVGRALTALVSGVHRCGSPWACPLCAPTIRQRRALEIDGAVERWLSAGGGCEFLTHTLSHHLGDTLESRMASVAHALRLTLNGSGWRRRSERLGYVGSIKSVEITYGRNGWHPHSHSLLFTGRPLTAEERLDLFDWIYGRWSRIAVTRGLGEISRAHGVDLRPVGGGAVGEYLTKVDGGWSVGLEIARSDLKAWSPVQLLREACETGDVEVVDLWREFEHATFGRRAIGWSKGLRDLLCGTEAESSDQELAASEGLDLALLRALVPSEVWNKAHRAGQVGQVLSEIEHIAAVLLWLSDQLGHGVEPLDLPKGARVDA
jgi:hypothetical protein